MHYNNPADRTSRLLDSLKILAQKSLALGSCLFFCCNASLASGQGIKPELPAKSASVATTTPAANATAEGDAISGEASSEAKSFESFVSTKIKEAKKLLAAECPLDNETVGISLVERQSGKIYIVRMTKTNFLTPGYTESFEIPDVARVSVRIDQPNYVNTKLSVEASEGLFMPLTVKYPIVKRGYLKEMAYYTPAHRSLQTTNFAKLGQEYIEKTLNDAAGNLKKRGFDIPDRVRNVAKLLCVVEHVDHDRFRNENSKDLFNEVLTLYALNRGDCYRYSVSSAGAGGMVQMIAPTYREIKRSFPEIDWVDDFEAGMINHKNAAKAMLLYLRRYHNMFLEHPAVGSALENGLATPEELMAAGYNSNPVRVPGKLSHGSNWKYALPRETQTYLTILHSLDSSVTTEPPRYHAKPVILTSKQSRYRSVRVRSRSAVRTRMKSSLRSRNKSAVRSPGKNSKVIKNRTIRSSAKRRTR